MATSSILKKMLYGLVAPIGDNFLFFNSALVKIGLPKYIKARVKARLTITYKVIMRTGQSFFIPSQGPKQDSIDAGLRWLLSQQCPEKMVVFCGVSNAKNICCSAVAKSIFSELVKRREITIPNVQGRIILATPQKLPYYFDGAVLAIHLLEAELEKIDAIPGSFDVFFVPWLETEGDAWKRRWGATDFSTGQKIASAVVAATQELDSILHSSCAPDIHHPSDYNGIIDTLSALHQSRKMPPQADISEFLKRNGWDFESADKVAEIAAKIAAGRVVRKR